MGFNAAKRSPIESVRLCGAAGALNKEHGGGFTLETMGVDGARTAAAGLLEQEELAQAYEDGAGMDLATAVEAARSILAGVGEGRSAG